MDKNTVTIVHASFVKETQEMKNVAESTKNKLFAQKHDFECLNSNTQPFRSMNIHHCICAKNHDRCRVFEMDFLKSLYDILSL